MISSDMSHVYCVLLLMIFSDMCITIDYYYHLRLVGARHPVKMMMKMTMMMMTEKMKTMILWITPILRRTVSGNWGGYLELRYPDYFTLRLPLSLKEGDLEVGDFAL